MSAPHAEPTVRPTLLVGSVVIDFDGTICPSDVSEEILRAFAPPEWWDIDLQFQSGEIGSRECLVRQGSLLGGRQDEMLAFALDRFGVEESFPPFVTWARERGLDVAVASDGLGFYVEAMLRAAGVEELSVPTNGFTMSKGQPTCDRFGALYADLVFAKKHLVNICRADGVPFLPWETFDDVKEGLEGADVLVQRTAPAVCPGWTVP